MTGPAQGDQKVRVCQIIHVNYMVDDLGWFSADPTFAFVSNENSPACPLPKLGKQKVGIVSVRRENF
jgi:hypothetical protein